MGNGKPARRSQAERRAETRAKLIAAARQLFVDVGFAETATPEIVRKAGVTRGALYHHFTDKTDLFAAVAEAEAQAIAHHIDAETRDVTDPELAMAKGSSAFFEAMLIPGRVRLLLEDAPAVLGYRKSASLTQANGAEELREGLKRALPNLSAGRIDALTKLLSAAFDRSALEIANGGDQAEYEAAMHQLVGQMLSAKNRS